MFYFLLFAVAQARVFRGASKSTRVFRFSAEMAHFASGGIGEEHFHERLAAGQAAAADGELMDEYEDDHLEDAMADCPAKVQQVLLCGLCLLPRRRMELPSSTTIVGLRF